MIFRDIRVHERGSAVVEVGAGMHNLTAGDRTVVPFTISCIGTVPERLASGGAETLDFTKDDRYGELTRRTIGRRPEACIDAVGVYGGLLDQIPLSAAITTGVALNISRTPAQQDLAPLLERIEKGEIGPFSVIWNVGLTTARTCIERSVTKKIAA